MPILLRKQFLIMKVFITGILVLFSSFLGGSLQKEICPTSANAVSTDDKILSSVSSEKSLSVSERASNQSVKEVEKKYGMG